jgi:hypothetical protein
MGTTNLIQFNIPSSDPGCGVASHVCTIALTECLGSSSFCEGLSQPAIIDGYTQPGASANTLAIGDNAQIKIKVVGDPAGDQVIRLCSPTGCGLVGDSSGSTVRGLCLTGSPNTHQILIFIGSNNDVVTGSFVGVDIDGTTVVGNGDPIEVRQNTSGNIIGGTSPAARNVMASDGVFGVILNDGNATLIQGNYIGTNAAGTAAIGLLGRGIDMEIGTGVIIGGTASGAGNVINGTDAGISIGGVQFNAAGNTTVQGNLIGTDATGTVAFNTLNNGIHISQSVNTTIGGGTTGAANVMNARANGILIDGSPTGTVIQGNKIGTDITGTMPLGNGNCGIAAGDTTNGIIGGTSAGEGNIIAFNSLNGISIAGFTGDHTAWAILGNSIHDNHQDTVHCSACLGITLAATGCGTSVPTVNDHCDPPNGANDQQNYPVITSASFSSNNVTLSGMLDSVASTMFRLEFFSNAQCNPSGFGEGQHFLGSSVVTTGTDCTTGFGPVSFPLPSGDRTATATATRLDSSSNPIETSEFSQCTNISGLPSPTPTPTATSTPAASSQLLNISTRMQVETGNNVLIGGFIITGNAPKNVALRGIGPSLGAFGVPDPLADPTLELHNSGGTILAQNNNWQDDPTSAAQLMALGLGLQDPNESGIVASLQPNAYTAVLAGNNGGTGVGLVEVYDTNQAVNSQLANISTRGFVLTGNNVMIGGFILGPNGNTHVVIRGIGPSLTQFGVPNALADPTLELHDNTGALLASNDNWQDDPTSAAQLTALGLAPSDPHESGIYMLLPPGAFTAILAGASGGTGVGLVEVYNVH